MAGEWYTSEALWTAAAVIVTAVVGTVAMWIAYIVGFPRRRLLYWMPLMAPLVNAPGGTWTGDLEVRHRGKSLDEPYVLKVQLVSRGRKSIPSNSYDNGEPIRLDIGVTVIELLGTVSDPPVLPIPKIALNGTELRIGPSLIGRRQRITFTLLTEGQAGHQDLVCKAPLIDVDVRKMATSHNPPRYAKVVLPLVALSVALPSGFAMGFILSELGIAKSFIIFGSLGLFFAPLVVGMKVFFEQRGFDTWVAMISEDVSNQS
jgi:hypothetical protein